jgi:predicted nucleic acid-binding protein
LSPAAECDQIEAWLAAPAAWVPVPGEGHAEIVLTLLRQLHLVGPLVSDAHLAALVLEHGTGIWSTDSDVARFPGRPWEDPLR